MEHPLLEHALRWARTEPAREAFVDVEPDGRFCHYSYEMLQAKVGSYRDILGRGLHGKGILPKERVLLLVTPDRSFLPIILAVIACGATPVFLDPGMGIANIKRCIADTMPSGFIGNGRAQLLRMLAAQELKCCKLFVSTSCLPLPNTLLLLRQKLTSALQIFTAPAFEENDDALIAFTSGATGTPKGVVYTVKTLRAQLELFTDSLSLGDHWSRDLPLLPIFSIYNVALGISSVFGVTHPTKPLLFDTKRVTRALRELGVESSFGSPTLWGKIAESAQASHETFPDLKRLYMAGVGVSTRVLEVTAAVLPNAQIFTPYGATESLPTTNLERKERLEKGDAALHFGYGTLVGTPLINVKIVAAADTIDINAHLPANTIGEIVVHGASVSERYLNRPEATASAKCFDSSGRLWHRMGDVGYLDTRGRLYYCGRKMHVVRAANGIFYSEPVENVFNAHPDVMRTALVYFSKTNEAGVVFEATSHADTNAIIQGFRELASAHPWTKALTRFERRDSFPVDARHNAKIFREKLGD